MRVEPTAEVNALSNRVIGAAIEVHRLLGPGYAEAIYEEALGREMKLQGIQFERQYPVGIEYKGEIIGKGQLDFLVGNCLVVELKAVEALLPVHTAQVISYLKMTQLSLGLLINFNVAALKTGIRRVVTSH
jgi:GxxExxY protein